MATQLRNAGLSVTVHDDIYEKTERDPWIFYDRGKEEMVVVTADKDFTKSFPHMAAVALGKTTILFFSKGSWRSSVRGEAFLSARSKIIHALKKRPSNFLASIGIGGSFRIVEDKPTPRRKLCDALDWESYKRVCETEGIALGQVEDEREEAYVESP